MAHRRRPRTRAFSDRASEAAGVAPVAGVLMTPLLLGTLLKYVESRPERVIRGPGSFHTVVDGMVLVRSDTIRLAKRARRRTASSRRHGRVSPSPITAWNMRSPRSGARSGRHRMQRTSRRCRGEDTDLRPRCAAWIGANRLRRSRRSSRPTGPGSKDAPRWKHSNGRISCAHARCSRMSSHRSLTRRPHMSG